MICSAEPNSAELDSLVFETRGYRISRTLDEISKIENTSGILFREP
jgi:hypothetical protein